MACTVATTSRAMVCARCKEQRQQANTTTRANHTRPYLYGFVRSFGIHPQALRSRLASCGHHAGETLTPRGDSSCGHIIHRSVTNSPTALLVKRCWR